MMAPKRDEFLPSMRLIAKVFGIPSLGRRATLLLTLLLLGSLLALEAVAIWKLIRTLSGWSRNPNGSVTARLSGAIFYGNGVLSMVLTWRLARRWRTFCRLWRREEVGGSLRLPPDAAFCRRVKLVAALVAVCAVAEHALSMAAATGGVPARLFLRRYILTSHGFLLEQREYSLWLAIPIFVLSKVATVLWNLQDLIIILISMGLTSKYKRLNALVRRIVAFESEAESRYLLQRYAVARLRLWRRVRASFVRQAWLVREADQRLGGLVLLSNLTNLYFICLQLFLAIRVSTERGSAISRVYYCYSLCWLLVRASAVLWAAGDVRIHSRLALPALRSGAAAAQNVEITRLIHELEHERVSLSGMALFPLSRPQLLAVRALIWSLVVLPDVAAAVVKYELILLQYDKGRN